jgi:prepilin-type N-terminal cleavage/methylation domain-containing protein
MESGEQLMKRSRGYTLFEVVLTVMIIGIIALVAVPVISSTTAAPGLKTAANMLMSDVEYVESASISTPQAMRVLRIDLATNRYWVAAASSSETPIASPADGQSYLNDFATGRSGRLSGVTIRSVTGMGTAGQTSFTITFNAYGVPSCSSGSNIVITLGSTNNATMTITIDGATGEVTIS